MVDLLESTARSQNPDAEIDDPLAELARIIGYERPAEIARTRSEEPRSNEFDLEAELMRELDFPQPTEVDELERREDVGVYAEQVADAGVDSESVQDDVAEPEDPWLDYPASDDADWDTTESVSVGALSEEGESDLAGDADEDLIVEASVAGGDDPAGVWETEEPDAKWDEAEPDVSTEHPISNTGRDEPGQVITADFSAGPVVPEAGAEDDDVLADMFRFELPARKPPAPEPQAAPDTRAGPESAPFGGAPDFDDGFGVDFEGFDEPALSGQVDTSVESGIPASTLHSEAQPSADHHNDAALDFEEYLSTELDVFGHEVALGEIDDRPQVNEPAVEPGTDAGVELQRALEALDVHDLDDQSSIFDEAAEELLADITHSDAMHAADAAPVETSESWSMDSIEDAVAEELDEELEDMFGLPEPVQEPARDDFDEADEFELDLEQVLAETTVDTSDDWTEPSELTAGRSLSEPNPEPDDWLGETVAEPVVERDQMAEAFLGLVPADTDEVWQPDQAYAPVAEKRVWHENGAPDADAGKADQTDWLAGYETPKSATSSAGSQAAGDDYFFDPELISEADETVEPVAYIDVPELEHDEPQPVDPDYDLEIEREFSGLVDRHEPDAGGAEAMVAGGGLAAADSWSRHAAAPRGYEASDDYIALERELGFGEDRLARSHGAAVAAEDDFDSRSSDDFEPMNKGAGTGSRGPVLALAVLGLALLAGVGAFGWSMLSGDDTTADGGPRIIRADTDPVKVLPENPGGVTVPNQDKAVYDRVAGGDTAATGQPALVNSAEEPMDVVQRTLDPEILPLEGRGDATVKSEDRLAAGGSDAEAGAGGAPAPAVSPRKVRTMVVKPDGSIVAREDPQPAPEAAPASEVATAAAPAQTETAAAPAVTAEPAPTTEVAEQAGTDAPAPAADAASGADAQPADGSIAPVRVVKTQPIRPVANAPVPEGRPADQPVTVVGTVTQTGNVAAAPAPAAPAPPVEVATAPATAAPAAANPGGYYVQIASQPSAEGAQDSWRALSSRYSSVLGGLNVDIQRADIPGKGIFHRVRVAAGTKDQANALCSRYKAAGGSCFVSR